MAFNSVHYLIFLFFAVVAYYIVPTAKSQRFILVIASVVFASFFNWVSLLFLILIVVGNYYLLCQLSNSESRIRKRVYLLGLISNICLLLFYKILQELFTGLGITLVQGFDNNRWIILGIGFYTLQIIGYYLDVFKASKPFTFSLSEFFLSIGFFAKLSSGPILNHHDSIQLTSQCKVPFTESNFAVGVQRILLGMLKKVVLADRLVPYVNDVFDKHQYINGLMIYLGPFLFTLQLYFDFSGYIDMAIGSARLLGIRLPENFNLPLRARSIADFWRRWHISLVNWLTHYIFYPISFQYRKLRKIGLAIAVITTFIVSAVWHGLAITFFIYAFCHFSYIIIENLVFRRGGKPESQGWLFNVGSVFLIWHLVAIGNFFFRLNALKDASIIVSDFMNLPFLYGAGITFKTWLFNGGQDIENEFNFRVTVLLCVIFLLLEKKINQIANTEKYQVTFVALILLLIVVFGMFNAGERFIYLQFS